MADDRTLQSNHQLRAIGYSLLSAISLAAAMISLGCAGNGEPTKPEPQEAWTDLNLTVTLHLNDIYFHPILASDNSGYYLPAGRDGVWAQRPAFTGTWKHLGPDLGISSQDLFSMGITSLVSTADGVMAGIDRKGHGDDLIQLSAGDVWVSRLTIDSLRVSYLAGDDRGNLVLGAYNEGLFASDDLGQTWDRVIGFHGFTSYIRLRGNGDLVLWYGATAFGSPILEISQDGGRTWASLPLRVDPRFAGGGSPPEANAGAVGDSLRVYFTWRPGFYETSDYGQHFRLVRETLYGPSLAVNPDNGDELYAASDSLYYTRDGGGTWEAYAPPIAAGRLGPVTVDWVHDKAILQLYLTEPDSAYQFHAALYAFDHKQALETRAIQAVLGR